MPRFLLLRQLPEHSAIPDASSKQKCDQCKRLWEQVVCHPLIVPYEKHVSVPCPFVQWVCVCPLLFHSSELRTSIH